MPSNICLYLSHAQTSHLGAKKQPLSHTISCRRLSLTHSPYDGPHFRVLWGPYGSNPKFDLLITTAYTWRNNCPNFVLLSTVVPEILTRKGGCDVINPLSFIISIDCFNCILLHHAAAYFDIKKFQTLGILIVEYHILSWSTKCFLATGQFAYFGWVW